MIDPAMTDDRRASPLRLKLRNRRDAIEQARRSVLDYLAPHRPCPATVYAAELVLEEALMNVISYAYGDRTAREIDLTVRVQGADIVIRIEDDGIAFDPLRVPEPPTPVSIDESVPGGLGIKLMRRAARSAAYERVGDRNVLTLAVACIERPPGTVTTRARSPRSSA